MNLGNETSRGARNTDGSTDQQYNNDKMGNNRECQEIISSIQPGKAYSTQDFFDALYDGEEVKTFYTFKEPKDGFRPNGGNLKEISTKLVKITGLHDEYFMPNLSHGAESVGAGIKDESIYKFFSIFLDFDENQKMPDSFHIQPSAIIKRKDGKGWHVYFFIIATKNAEQWKKAQQMFLNYYHSDPHIKNPARWMRVPGSTRYKQEENNISTNPKKVLPPMRYEIIKCDNVRYSLEMLEKTFPKLQQLSISNSTNQEHESSWVKETPETLLKIVLDKIKNAQEGERNGILNLWAGRIYQKFSKDKWNELNHLLTDTALSIGLSDHEIMSTLNSAQKYADENKDNKESKGRPRKSKQAIELLKAYPICKYKDKRYMIRGNQAIQIGSRSYKDLISREFYRATGDPITSVQIDEVVSIHRAQAGESEERKIYIRTAAQSSTVTYIDLNDGKNTIIEVDAEGWRISENPQVLFFRPSNMESLPMPLFNGSIERLKEVFNLERAEDFPVMIAALCYILRGRPNDKGSYPIIVATGIEGSAKTTFMKIVKKMIDPGTPETRTPSNDTKDLFIAANNGLVLSLDNISYINREMSDALCSLATGGGFARKMNYTDDEEQIFDLCRPILLNGISFSKAPDLLSRSIIIELKPISGDERKTEAEIWSRVDRYRPSIFGGLLTMISKAIEEETKKNDEQLKLPRLADFGKFSIALERGNGWEAGKIAASLKASYDAALGENAEANPIIPIVIEIVQETGLWSGSATDLLKAINEKGDDSDKRLSLWPKTAAKMGTLLKRDHNIYVSKGIRIKQTRIKCERRWELSTKPKAKEIKVIPDSDNCFIH